MSMLTPRGFGARKPVRRGRRRGLAALIVVAVLAAAGAGAWWFTQREADPVATKPRVTCPPPSPTPTAVAPAAIRVNVFNATERRGLASRVAGELTKRGFKVAKIDNDPLDRKVTAAAEIRSGATGKDAARTVMAQVPEPVAVPDQRKDASVDLVIGAAFTSLQTQAQAAEALVPTPAPRPSGC